MQRFVAVVDFMLSHETSIDNHVVIYLQIFDSFSVTMLNWDKKSRYISHRQKRTQAWETVYCLTYSIVLYRITDWITAYLSWYVLYCQILAKTQPNISQFHSFLTFYGQIIHQLISNNLQISSLIQKIISCKSVVPIKNYQKKKKIQFICCLHFISARL